MALHKIIAIQSHERLVVVIAEGLEHGFSVGVYPGVVAALAVGVFHKEHILEQAHQPVANPQAVFVGLAFKSPGHLGLGVVFRPQVVYVVPPADEEVVAHILRMQSEKAVEHLVVDKRLGKQHLAEPQSEALYLIGRKWQRRREMAQAARQ